MSHPETLSLSDFARHINCKRNYVSQLKRENRLVLTADDKVLVAQSIKRIASTRDPSKAGVAERHAQARGGQALTGHEPADLQHGQAIEAIPVMATDPGRLYDYQDAKAKREHWAAERERAAFLKEAGDLMDKGEVIAAFAHAGATLRGKLEAWSATLPPQLEGRDEQAIRTLLAEQVEMLLGDLSQVFSQQAAETAA